MSFARTKIQPPRARAGTLLPRPALAARLAQALATQRLVLVSAAAGYGKSSLLTQQIECLPAGTALAWVAADEGDDLSRLLACLVAALEPLDPPWRTAPEALGALAVQPRSRATAAAELLNALEACEVARGMIVFDDLHRVDDPAFFDFLDRVLERLGQRWTVAIATRHDPPLALARLRVAGELAEFRQADLQLSAAEVGALLSAQGLDASQAEALHERTQGWAAGLCLALTPGAHHPANDRVTFDFLASEVIAQLEPALRLFLMQTSVLREITAQRAAAVSGNAQAAQLLEQVERLGLFVTTLAAAEPTLKLHDLFREALERQLMYELPGDCAGLWLRAAQSEPDAPRKLEMLLKGGHLQAAAGELLANISTLVTEGATATAERLLAQFPASFAHESPLLQFCHGLLAWSRLDYDRMLVLMGRAETLLAAAGQAGHARAAAGYQAIALLALGRHVEAAARLAEVRPHAPQSLEVRIVLLKACIFEAAEFGDSSQVARLMDELVDLVEPLRDAMFWYRANLLVRFNGLAGTQQAMARFIEGALRTAGERPIPVRVLALGQQAFRLAWQQADLAAAMATLHVAQQDSRWLGNPPILRMELQTAAAMLHALRGDGAAAIAAAQVLVDEHPPGQGRDALWNSVWLLGRVAALADDLPLLRSQMARLRRFDADGGSPIPQRRLMLALLDGHAARLAGQPGEAAGLWQQALVQGPDHDRLGLMRELRLFLAAALLQLQRTADAADVLQPVLQTRDAGAVLLARRVLGDLASADWRGMLDDADQQRLQAWQALAATAPLTRPDDGHRATPPAPGFGDLSPREVDVLARIAAGDSNKLIARAFDLSPHTVKRHVANILDKLGAASRTQAAAWYLRQSGG